jgi:hypothetical protein
VLNCLDLNSPLHNELFSAQNSIFLVGRNLPRNILNYNPIPAHTIINGKVSPNMPRKKTIIGILKDWLNGNL